MGKRDKLIRRVAAAEANQIEVRFVPQDRVGAAQAENDRANLLEQFHDPGYLPVLRDTGDSRCIIVGRTGAGKTAYLLKLENSTEHHAWVDPVAVALSYLEHHTSIPKLASIGINLDAFFQFLWRQTLVVQVLRGWRELQTVSQWSTLKHNLTRNIRLTAKQVQRNRVLDEIERWAGDSWASSTDHTKEVIRRFDNEVKLSLGREGIAKLDAAMSQSSETRTNSSSPAASEVTALQELVQSTITRLIHGQRAKTYAAFLAEEVLTDPHKPQFIFIDQLDTAWIESQFAYDLIDALIEVAGEFAEIGNIKVVVALRQDIVMQLHASTRRRSRQWEKHKSFFLELQWPQDDLVHLVDKRLRSLLRGRWGGVVGLRTLLPAPPPRSRGTTVDYVMRRTLMRPRDLIAFVNTIVAEMSIRGVTKLNWEVLGQAEAVYSRERLEALENEWQLNHRGLRHVFEVFRESRPLFTLGDLEQENDRLTVVLAAAERATPEELRDPGSVPLACQRMINEGEPLSAIWTLLIDLLFKIGFLGAKRSSGEAIQYSYQDRRLLPQPVPQDMPLQVHPAFWRALHIDGSATGE